MTFTIILYEKMDPKIKNHIRYFVHDFDFPTTIFVILFFFDVVSVGWRHFVQITIWFREILVLDSSRFQIP